MGLHKQRDDYESFEYLEPGEDYREFELLDGYHAGEPYEVPLSSEEERRAERLSEENVIVSLHEHPIYRCPKDVSESEAYWRQGRTTIPFGALADSNLDAIFDNHLAGMAISHSKSGWKWDDVVHDVGMKASDVAHQDFVIRIETVDDIYRAHEEGKVGFIPTLESCQVVENELDRFDVLYGMGVRCMDLTHSSSNMLGTTGSTRYERDGGLTMFGVEAIERMNKLGMLIDASHASDQTIIDAAEVSDDPIAVTHNGAKGVMDADGLKLVSDEAIEAVAESGGLVGIKSAPFDMASEEHPRNSIESVMDHFEYVRDLVGLDHVSFGVDALYGDHIGLQRQYFDEAEYEKYPDWVDFSIDYVKGMENPTEAWHNIVRWFVKEDYSDEEIGKILGRNTLRVLEEVW